MAADADRLRQAADRLDGWSMYDWEGDQAYPALDAVAALLRAVADEHETFAEWVGPAVMKDYDSATFNVALALADVILGGAE